MECLQTAAPIVSKWRHFNGWFQIPIFPCLSTDVYFAFRDFPGLITETYTKWSIFVKLGRDVAMIGRSDYEIILSQRYWGKPQEIFLLEHPVSKCYMDILSPFRGAPDSGAFSVTPATVARRKDTLSCIVTLLSRQRIVNGRLSSE